MPCCCATYPLAEKLSPSSKEMRAYRRLFSSRGRPSGEMTLLRKQSLPKHCVCAGLCWAKAERSQPAAVPLRHLPLMPEARERTGSLEVKVCDREGWVRLPEGGCPGRSRNLTLWSPLAKDPVTWARGHFCFVVPAHFHCCVRVWGACLGVPHFPQLPWCLQSWVQAVLVWEWGLRTGKHRRWRGNSYLLK